MRVARGAWGLAIAGLGLIVLGLTSIALFITWRTDQPPLATDFAAVPASVHYEAPAIALSDLSGRQHALADYRGQVTLVNLWATWCPPCQAEMPLLQAYYDKHRAEGFTVLAIEDGEPAGDVRDFVKQYGMTFPVLLDPNHEATDRAFKTINLPSTYVVDRNGQVRLAWYGAISAANLEKYVTPLIGER